MKKTLLISLFTLITYLTNAQTKGMKPVEATVPTGTERRMALVVGNKDYTGLSKLLNPLNDADDMEIALKKMGFDVIKATNADYKTFVGAVNRFKEKLSDSDVAFVYYSGHGASYNGKNYLLPVDATVTCLEQIEEYGISLNRILGEVSSKGVRNSFIVLDACRNIPNLKMCDKSQRDVFDGSGLARPTNNPHGSYIVYATKEGSTADDNHNGRNGLFTEALLRYLTVPNVSAKAIIDRTSLDVYSKSKGSQSPGRYDEIYGDFYFLVTDENDKNINPVILNNYTPTSNQISKEVQKEFDDYIDLGQNAVNQNARLQAITHFLKAKNLSKQTGVNSPKAIEVYNSVVAKGDKYFLIEEYETAQSWFLVAEAIKEEENIKKKINECTLKQ
jgi:Caspase domain